MDKFGKNGRALVWQKNDALISTDCENIHFVAASNIFGLEPATREEFTAAALQAIEKLKAQGIDIGTEWLPKWEPKPGEVVWCWDDNYTRPMIGRYEAIKGIISYPHTVHGVNYQHIAPFTGEIPEPFKSRWEAERNDPA